MKVRIGDLTKIRTGKLDANAASMDGQYPFFTCSKEPLRISTYSYDCECVLVAGNGDLNVKYYNGKFDAYQRTYIIENNNIEKLYLPYLYYFLETYIEELRKQAIGGVIKYIKICNLRDAVIELPSIEKQKKIVKILKSSKKCLDMRNTQMAVLDGLIKARFVEMFGKRDYEERILGDICSKITDGTHKTPRYLKNGIVFISAKNIVNGELNFDDIKYISEDEYQDIQKRCQTEKGDILLSKSGSLGAPVIVKTSEKLGLFESLAVLKYDRKLIVPEFLCEQLKSDAVQRQFKMETKGVAIKHLHLGVISMTKIIVPPMYLQNEFADFVQQVNKSKLLSLIKLLEQLITYLYNVFIIYRQDKGEEVEDHE